VDRAAFTYRAATRAKHGQVFAMEETAYRKHYEVEDRHWWYRGRWAVVEALLAGAGLPPEPRILDAGCGTGGNLERFGRIGVATGVEPSPQAVALCRERGLPRVHESPLEALPFDDGGFDLVAATDVIEHIAAEREALTELRRVTAPGGTMLLTVPAYMWLWSPEDVKLHHQRRYTRPRLEQAVRGAGWEPRFATYFNSILLAPIALAKKLRRSDGDSGDLERTPALLDGPLSLPMRLEARLIRAGVRLPAGVSIGIVCRNPG
jgi:SAM-dependent methyltransferase